MAKPTTKNTKAEILEAYNKLEVQIANAKVATTQQVVATKAKDVAVTAAKQTTSTIASIEATAMDSIKHLLGLTEQCNELDAAIVIKKQEIKDIHDFEYNANSCATIVAAQNELVATKQSEAVSIVANAKTEATDIISEANTKASEIKQSQTRKQAEWDYDFKRNCQIASDNFQDGLDIRERELATKEDAVSLREDTADALETKVLSLTSELEEFKSAQSEVVATAVESIKEDIAKSSAISKGFSDRAHKQDLAMKDIEISTLTDKVNDLTSQLGKSTELVANANASVADMAKSALTAAADKQTVAELTNIVASAGQNKK